MDKEDSAFLIVLITALAMFFLIILGIYEINKPSLYECYTVDGQKVMCKTVCHTQYQITGKDFNGTTFQLRSYKEIKERTK